MVNKEKCSKRPPFCKRAKYDPSCFTKSLSHHSNDSSDFPKCGQLGCNFCSEDVADMTKNEFMEHVRTEHFKFARYSMLNLT